MLNNSLRFHTDIYNRCLQTNSSHGNGLHGSTKVVKIHGFKTQTKIAECTKIPLASPESQKKNGMKDFNYFGLFTVSLKLHSPANLIALGLNIVVRYFSNRK